MKTSCLSITFLLAIATFTTPLDASESPEGLLEAVIGDEGPYDIFIEFNHYRDFASEFALVLPRGKYPVQRVMERNNVWTLESYDNTSPEQKRYNASHGFILMRGSLGSLSERYVEETISNFFTRQGNEFGTFFHNIILSHNSEECAMVTGNIFTPGKGFGNFFLEARRSSQTMFLIYYDYINHEDDARAEFDALLSGLYYISEGRLTKSLP